jgi:hypothetical protein
VYVIVAIGACWEPERTILVYSCEISVDLEVKQFPLRWGVASVYNTYLDKVNRACKILGANVKDGNGMMIFTLIVPAHLIERDE